MKIRNFYLMLVSLFIILGCSGDEEANGDGGTNLGFNFSVSLEKSSIATNEESKVTVNVDYLGEEAQPVSVSYTDSGNGQLRMGSTPYSEEQNIPLVKGENVFYFKSTDETTGMRTLTFTISYSNGLVQTFLKNINITTVPDNSFYLYEFQRNRTIDQYTSTSEIIQVDSYAPNTYQFTITDLPTGVTAFTGSDPVLPEYTIPLSEGVAVNMVGTRGSMPIKFVCNTAGTFVIPFKVRNVHGYEVTDQITLNVVRVPEVIRVSGVLGKALLKDGEKTNLSFSVTSISGGGRSNYQYRILEGTTVIKDWSTAVLGTNATGDIIGSTTAGIKNLKIEVKNQFGDSNSYSSGLTYTQTLKPTILNEFTTLSACTIYYNQFGTPMCTSGTSDINRRYEVRGNSANIVQIEYTVQVLGNVNSYQLVKTERYNDEVVIWNNSKVDTDLDFNVTKESYIRIKVTDNAGNVSSSSY